MLLARVIRQICAGYVEPRAWKDKMANTASQAAAAGMATQHAHLEFYATVGPKMVRLVQVPLDGSPWPAPARGTTFCLDVHENNHAVDAAIDYVRWARSVEPGSVLRFTPSVFALVNTSALSREQMRLINDELISAGASIFEYPKACGSFREAMHALFEEIKESRRAYAEERGMQPSRFGSIARIKQSLVSAVPERNSVKAVGQGASSGSLNASAAE